MMVGNQKIGVAHTPYIVAEMSGNHNGSLERAFQIVDTVAQSKAHAVKLQTYTADTMTVKSKEKRFLITAEKSLWKGRNLYDLYEEAHTPWQWHKKIFDRCKKRGLTFFSSPFDETAVDFLETLNVSAYKIASLEIQNLPLIQRAAQTKKPLIISCGCASIADIGEAVECARTHGCKELMLLKCASSYPAMPEGFNLKTLPHLSEAFGVPVGLSDHSQGIGVALASISFGSSLIEKHVTLSRKEGGVDSAFSLEPVELAQLAVEAERAWQAQGKICYEVSPHEHIELRNRRSLYFIKDLKSGDVITKEHVKAIRPGGGLPPKYLEMIIGCKVQHNIKINTPVTFETLHQ